MESRHDSDSLVPVTNLPYQFQALFKYRYFNSVQSESFSEAYLSDDNMVVSAPTGSGKTGLFELCILRLLSKCLSPDGRFNHPRGARKIVYVAPMKALIQEKLREWKEKFGQGLGLACQELTGDSDSVNLKDMQGIDLILTTPEKFDSTTRRCREHGGAGFFGDIALLLIDEVHLLNDSRGASLEAIVSRIKILAHYPELKSCPISTVRLVAVSATIPNVEDLAEWLMVPTRAIKRFGEEMRPVKLTTRVYGYPAAKNDFLFEKRLQNYLYDIILQHSSGRPTLVFCSTRKGAQDAAMILAETVSKSGVLNPYIKSREQMDRLKVAACGASDKSLQHCIQCGVGYHNGGLGFAERGLVEGLFLQGNLQVLCTTMTLAHGMNLPAHLVIIKSTQYYNKEKARYLEYDRSTLLQMCGRAGRPQFDDSGVVVLMTRNETVHLYENLLSGSEPVESELLPSIAEHLNAEIVLMTVSDVGLAMEWLKCSYLYVRIRKNPQHYGIRIPLPEEQMDKHLRGCSVPNSFPEICLKTINELANYGMLLMDEYGFTLKYLEPGRLMAKYYLNFETMKTITKVADRSTSQDLLFALAKAQELSWIQLRRHEKRQLNAINQEMTPRIKFHILDSKGKMKKRIQSAAEKIFVLVNDALSGEPSSLDFTMTQDLTGICTHGTRIVRCMAEYFKFMKRFSETKSALLLAKCLQQKLWEDSPYQLKQLPGVGTVTAKAFLSAGITTFEKLESADPRQLEFITGRKFPFGDQVKSTLSSLPPKVCLKLQDTGLQIGGKDEFTLELIRLDPVASHSTSKWHMADLIVGDECGNQILFYEKIRLEQFASPYVVPVYSTSSISAALISEQYVGVDSISKPINFISPKRSSNFTMHEKTDQRKKKAQATAPPCALSAVNYESELRLEVPKLQDRLSRKDFSAADTKLLSVTMPITSYFDYDGTSVLSTEPQALDFEKTSETGVGVINADKASGSTPHSPPGQDLKSLRSFLMDPAVQECMCWDEGYTGLTDMNSTLSSPDAFISQSLKRQRSSTSRFANSSSSPADKGTGEIDDSMAQMRGGESAESPAARRIGGPHENPIHLRCQSFDLCSGIMSEESEDLSLKKHSYRSSSMNKYERNSRKETDNSNDIGSVEFHSDGRSRNSHHRDKGFPGLPRAIQSSVVPRSNSYPEKAGCNVTSHPHFSLGFPTSPIPIDDSTADYASNMQAQEDRDHGCEPNYGRVMTPSHFNGKVQALSPLECREVQPDSLGSKSLFSFLFE